MQASRPISPDTSALENLPHLMRQLCELWGKEEFEKHVNGVLMDSQDGRRQGLPAEAMEDLLFLLELTIAKRALYAAESAGIPFHVAFRQHLEKSRKFTEANLGKSADPWSRPDDRDLVRRVDHGVRPVKRAPAQKKSWWRRLLE